MAGAKGRGLANQVGLTEPPSRRASAGSRHSFETAAAYDLPGKACREREPPAVCFATGCRPGEEYRP